jgi:hypothetical protein
VIGSVSSLILGGIFGKRVSEFQEAIPKLAVGETKVFPGNMKMNKGFHTISLSVTRREVEGKSVYDLMVTNTGGACGWHIWKRDTSGGAVILPLILEGMTLEQITDREFVKNLKFNSTCGKEDSSGYELYGHLKDYAMQHENIRYIGKTTPSSDTVTKKSESKIQKYIELGMPLQNLGNCICRSPLAMINAVMRQMGKNPQRIFLMLAVKEWEKLHDKDRAPPPEENLAKLHKAYLKEIQQQVKNLAQVENGTEETILLKYFTPKQRVFYYKALNP